MKVLTRLSLILAVVGIVVGPVAAAQQHPAMPAGMTHEEHMAQMKKEAELKQRGQMAMGFDQDKATHHFTLTAEGGAIAVDANDAADETTLAQIRTHLQEIARAFAQGDFEKPLMTHGEMPPGVATMQRLEAAITYTYRGHRARGRRPDCLVERQRPGRHPRLPPVSNHGARDRRSGYGAEVATPDASDTSSAHAFRRRLARTPAHVRERRPGRPVRRRVE